MSVPPPGWFPAIVEPGCVSPGAAEQYRNHPMRGIVRMIPATDRM